MKMGWKDEHVEVLKKLWAKGLSASQIAGRIGDVTRNAVIGKVHRLGLSGRAPAASRTASRRRIRIKLQASRNNVARVRLKPEPFVPLPEVEVPLAERRRLMEIEDTCCRWIIGDVQHEHHFCNKAKLSGLPYCEAHVARAYAPPEPRPRKVNGHQPQYVAGIRYGNHKGKQLEFA